MFQGHVPDTHLLLHFSRLPYASYIIILYIYTCTRWQMHANAAIATKSVRLVFCISISNLAVARNMIHCHKSLSRVELQKGRIFLFMDPEGSWYLVYCSVHYCTMHWVFVGATLAGALGMWQTLGLVFSSDRGRFLGLPHVRCAWGSISVYNPIPPNPLNKGPLNE